MFEDIKDKVVVLTGGCGVFGSVFSMALINAGAKVAILDYKQGRCEECLQGIDRKSTRLNSSHLGISYAVFCLKKKNKKTNINRRTSMSTHTPHMYMSARIC